MAQNLERKFTQEDIDKAIETVYAASLFLRACETNPHPPSIRKSDFAIQIGSLRAYATDNNHAGNLIRDLIMVYERCYGVNYGENLPEPSFSLRELA